MSIDKEVEEIRLAIANVHKTFYKLTRGMENITLKLDSSLSDFTDAVGGVQTDVHNIRGGVNHITAKFPSRAVYIGSLLALDVVVWVLAGFLLYKIIHNLRHHTHNSTRLVMKHAQKYGYAVRQTPSGQLESVVVQPTGRSTAPRGGYGDDVEEGYEAMGPATWLLPPPEPATSTYPPFEERPPPPPYRPRRKIDSVPRAETIVPLLDEESSVITDYEGNTEDEEGQY